jgi:hypothetical protein
MVGLGKTTQLAMAAMLMALWGNRPVLIIAPKVLLWQWQHEMEKRLGMPSAVCWIAGNRADRPKARHRLRFQHALPRLHRRPRPPDVGLARGTCPTSGSGSRTSRRCSAPTSRSCWAMAPPPATARSLRTRTGVWRNLDAAIKRPVNQPAFSTELTDPDGESGIASKHSISNQGSLLGNFGPLLSRNPLKINMVRAAGFEPATPSV